MTVCQWSETESLSASKSMAMRQLAKSESLMHSSERSKRSFKLHQQTMEILSSVAVFEACFFASSYLTIYFSIVFTQLLLIH